MRLEPISKKSASAGSNSGDLALASAHRLSAAGVIKVCAPSQLSFSKSFFSSPLVKSRFSGWLSGALALYSLALPANNCLGNESVFEPGIALWASASARKVREDPPNRGNLFAKTPREMETVEARPDLKIQSSPWKITARPQLLVQREVVSAAGIQETNRALLRWSEAFGSLALSEDFSVDYGLQNFQWGPAESASPSNRFFRETIQSKDSLYLVRGKHLVRLTYSPSSSWSEVLLFEPTGNGEAEPEPNEAHSLKTALKSEISWAGGSNFAGLVLGWRERSGVWLGEFVNLELWSGLFLYADAAHEKGNKAYYPSRIPGSELISFAQKNRDNASLEHYATIGLRYAFESGMDWRLETILQSAGYSTEELGWAAKALASPHPAQLAILFSQSPAVRFSGLDFPSRHYLFSSLRLPNVFNVQDWAIYVRGLESLEDHSSTFFASSENAVGSHGTFLGNIGLSLGDTGGELRGPWEIFATLAYRHAW